MNKIISLLLSYGAGASILAFLFLADTGAAQSPSPSVKSEHQSGGLSAKDRRFVMAAAKGGMMEVAEGKLASENAKHAEVKKFGERMVTDHSKANDELTAIASAKGVELSATKPAGKWKNDREYVEMMVKDHEKDLADFQAEAKDGSDRDVKKFAKKTSKMIEKHLQLIKDIQSKMK